MTAPNQFPLNPTVEICESGLAIDEVIYMTPSEAALMEELASEQVTVSRCDVTLAELRRQEFGVADTKERISGDISDRIRSLGHLPTNAFPVELQQYLRTA